MALVKKLIVTTTDGKLHEHGRLCRAVVIDGALLIEAPDGQITEGYSLHNVQSWRGGKPSSSPECDGSYECAAPLHIHGCFNETNGVKRGTVLDQKEEG